MLRNNRLFKGREAKYNGQYRILGGPDRLGACRFGRGRKKGDCVKKGGKGGKGDKGDKGDNQSLKVPNLHSLNRRHLKTSNKRRSTLKSCPCKCKSRANGFSFGVKDDFSTFGSGADGVSVNVRANNATTTVNGGIGNLDTFTLFAANQASILDGLTVTLVADVNGYTFSFSDINAQTANPIINYTGTFAGTEFVDTFGDNHFYATVQQFNVAADTVADFSTARIEVATAVPEPTSASLLLAGGLGLIMRRRRK